MILSSIGERRSVCVLRGVHRWKCTLRLLLWWEGLAMGTIEHDSSGRRSAALVLGIP